MRISAKGEYAIKAMLDLAMHRGRTLVPIQAIAGRQGIPQRYLEQVLLARKRTALLTSKRGSTGGYHLTKLPEDITIGAILRAVDGGSAPFDAIAHGRRNGAREKPGLGGRWPAAAPRSTPSPTAVATAPGRTPSWVSCGRKSRSPSGAWSIGGRSGT